MNPKVFKSLTEVAQDLRDKLKKSKYILLFANNGTGKTRLSMEFKKIGITTIQLPRHQVETVVLNDGDGTEFTIDSYNEHDTLYFNAFTEDLFIWDNDLFFDKARVLRFNPESRFIRGLLELDLDTRIRSFLGHYVDFDFRIQQGQLVDIFKRVLDDPDVAPEWHVEFSRKFVNENGIDAWLNNIKISRGEENLFIWCFFLAIVQLVIDDNLYYNWVKYIYIDDPISSLDENHSIAVATDLAKLIKSIPDSRNIKVIISTHHTLFYNIMFNELNMKRIKQAYFLSKTKGTNRYLLRETGDTPFFHHVEILTQLMEARETGKIYTYHFNMLRTLLEKTSSFHGFNNFSDCIKKGADDPDGVIHARIINLLSHGKYSLFEPVEMVEENKEHFRNILDKFLTLYRFNPELFKEHENKENDQASQ